MDRNKAIGLRIKEARRLKRWTQEQLARSLNRDQRSISVLENGKINIILNDLYTIAETLEQPISFFLEIELDTDDLDERLFTEFKRLPSNDAKQTAIQMLKAFRQFATPDESESNT